MKNTAQLLDEDQAQAAYCQRSKKNDKKVVSSWGPMVRILYFIWYQSIAEKTCCEDENIQKLQRLWTTLVS